ncbi:MAG: oligosaccharide flippase family protein [Proteobacteria bacterium]|nr:oligosaccharide flippase family protein [Pseudomonadota bacterium]
MYGIPGITGKAMGIILLPILTRYLSPDEYGMAEFLTVSGNIISCFIILAMNASQTIFFYDAETETDKKNVITTRIVFLLVWGSLITGTVLLAAPSVLRLASQQHIPFIIIAFAFAGIFVNTIREAILGLFRLVFWKWRYIVLANGQLVITYGLMLVFIVGNGMGLTGYFLAPLIGASFAVLAGLFWMRKWLRGRFSFSLNKKMLAFGIPLMPTDLALWWISFGERFFIMRDLSMAQLGAYSVGARLASVVTLAMWAFRLAWGPLALSMQKEPESRRFYSFVDGGLKAAASCFVILLTAVSPIAIDLLASPKYYEGYQVVGFVSYGAFFSSIYWVSGLAIVIHKKTAYLTTAIIISSLASIGLFLGLIPLFGMVGAAAAGCLSHVIGNLFVVYFGEKVEAIGFSIPRTIAMVIWTLAAIATELHIIKIPVALIDKVVYLSAINFVSWLALVLLGVRLAEIKRIIHHLKGMIHAR